MPLDFPHEGTNDDDTQEQFEEYRPQYLAEFIQDRTGRDPFFSCNFILNPNRTPDPRGDAYLDVLGAFLIRDNGTALFKPIDPEIVHYLVSLGISDPQRMVQIGENNRHEYPYGSAEAAFLKLSLNKQRVIRRKLQDSAFYPNFITDDALKIAEILEIPFGNIDLRNQENAEEISNTSHSKSFLRSQAEKFGFQIPIGRVIPHNGPLVAPSELKKILLELQEEAKRNSFLSSEEGEQLEYWLKFDALSGGDGTVFIASLADKEIEKALLQIQSIAQKCGMDLSHFPMSLVVEVGANSLPGKNVLGNINIQALIGEESDIDMFETSIQKTDEEGNYLGNSLPFPEKSAIFAIQEEYKKVCRAYQALGYRGMIGGDAIVSRNHDKSYAVEWFDINPRINGSQAFQEQYRMLLPDHPHLTGLNTNLVFPEGVFFRDMRNKIGNLLFDLENLGVLPVALRSNDQKNPVVKCSLFGKTAEDLQKILQEIRNLGIKV